MRTRQQGVSLGGLLIVLFIVVIVGIFSLKLIPAYMEYYKVKAAVEAIARDKRQSSSVAEVRKAFDARATIDDISSVKASDLEVTKEGGEVVISFAYRREVPVGGNVGLFVDFIGSSKGQ
jgi:Tfp pilus assembly major pilin PilA